jgi:hypothetical protein
MVSNSFTIVGNCCISNKSLMKPIVCVSNGKIVQIDEIISVIQIPQRF